MKDIFEKPEFNKIYFNDKTYTNDFLQSAIKDFSSYLIKNKKNDSPFIYLFAVNHIKTVIAYFSIIKAGFIVVLIDPEIKSLELKERMNDTPPMALVIINENNDVYNHKEEIIFQEPSNINISLNELKDVCTIVYTNAEDGYQKGAMLTKKNLLSNAEAIMNCDNINSLSICCSMLPLHHLFGMQTGILGPVFANSVILLLNISDLRIIKNIIDLLININVTNFYSVPMIYYLINKVSLVNNNLSQIKSWVAGGYKLPKSIFDIFYNHTCQNIHEGYGLTEASPVCTWHYPDDKIKIDSVGRAFSCCNIKIFNSNDAPLKIEEIGEICVKGDNVMKGYYNKPATNAVILKNGWLHTGDLGKIDNEGYVYITGLKKNMLNVGGKNVYPKEVERLIKYNKNVDNVNVYAGSEGIQGHKVYANIVLKNNSIEERKNVKSWCIENISNYKVPKVFDFL